MNEYTLEMKWKWIVETHGFPKDGLVKRLFAKVPKPKGSELKNYSFPLWDLIPLNCKLPDLGIKDVSYTRGKIGSSILTSHPDADFITYDPHCYEHDSRKYDPLHDWHLINYFKSGKLIPLLRKNGILDKDNYPKCSVADMNAYRFYLNRIHKDLVKLEHKKFLEEVNEKLLWKTAQRNSIRQYFKKLSREEALIKTEENRKQLAKEQHAKELKLYQRLRRWDERLANRAEKLKLRKIINKELAQREKKRFEEVLERGKLNATNKRLKSMKGIKVKKMLTEKLAKKKIKEKEFKANLKAEKYLFDKQSAQHNKIALHKQLMIIKDRSRLLDRKKREIKQKYERQRFSNQLHCRKTKQAQGNEEIVEQSGKDAKKNLILDTEKEKGVNYILEILKEMDDRHGGEKITFDENFILRKIIGQLIKRTIFINLVGDCRHLISMLLNYLLQPGVEVNKDLPDFDPKEMYFPGGRLLDVNLLSEMESSQKADTSGLKVFLIKKQKLLSTIVLNAKRLAQLVYDRVELLKAVEDPYKDIPDLKQDIIESRKMIRMSELVDRLLLLLTINDPSIFNSFISDLGPIANLIAYAKFLPECDEIIYQDIISTDGQDRLREQALKYDEKIENEELTVESGEDVLYEEDAGWSYSDEEDKYTENVYLYEGELEEEEEVGKE